MKITFIEESNGNPNEKNGMQRIVIDNRIDTESSISFRHLFVKSDDTFQKLINLSFDELKDYFDYISYTLVVSWGEYPLNISIAFPSMIEDDKYILLHPEINYLKWDKPYSIGAFVDQYKNLISAAEGVNLIEADDRRYELVGDFFGMEIIISHTDKPIKEFIEEAVDKLKLAYLHTLEILNDEYSSDSIIVAYHFPKEIKAACNQYLMYFAQFLSDLGIDAETSIKEQSSKVLFTVTPVGKDQALEMIYKALLIYTEAPNNMNDEISNGDIAVIQWRANILHLKSQIELTKAILQAKEETIKALTIANYQLQSFISKDSSYESKRAGNEDIFGGLATVDNLKLKGITIKLPELLRRLKRTFR
ncbi:MAG: hypothetical protein ACTHMD_05555 [Flavisolibacter sp.]